ncbi:MAG: ScbA/BarX family gamma-butyrolactone biosynthesis protein, partial [Stackebrandtia sp.]
LVHRAAVSEVFVTSLAATHDGFFQVGAQWPRAHQFFGPKSRLHDPMLLTESIRQATLAIAHQYYQVPHDSHFVMNEISYEIDKQGIELGCRPADVVLTAVTSDIRKRGKTVAGMRIDFTCHRDGRRAGAGHVTWRCISAATYARVRGARIDTTEVREKQPAPVAPHLVGRQQDCAVVLAPSAVDNLWLIRVDTDHPVMFDHPVDHVPGMMAMEAARQAALLVMGDAHAVPVKGSFAFDHYVELDAPCVVAAAPVGETAGDGRVRVKFEQSGRTAVVGDLELLTVA